MRKTGLALLAIAGLALTGCGGAEASPESTPAPSVESVQKEATPEVVDEGPSKAYQVAFDECMKNWSEGAAALSGGVPADYMDNKENIEVCEGVASLEDMGGADSSEPLPANGEASPMIKGDDFFFVSASNATGKFTLPTKAPAGIEKLRTTAGGDKVSYALVQIDNREGMDYANMYAMNVYGADGAKYEFSSVDEHLDSWQSNVERTVANNDLNADLVDAINHYQDGVDAGMVGEIWMATEGELPDEFAQITVEVHGAGSPDNAVSTKDSQGVDLTFEVPEKNKK